MYLIDTNVWLERLLDQERRQEVGTFLASIPASRLIISDFSFHSIGVILDRLEKLDVLMIFVQDIFIDHNVVLATVEPESMASVVGVMKHYSLDFDDAYQYVSAELLDARIISFDKDFDRTQRGRMTPGEILSEL